jgi:predicted nucleotidyltransferase
MTLKSMLDSRVSEFLLLCKKHEVKSLYAFGSSITDFFDEENSDIDLIVSFDIDDPIHRGEMMMSLWDELEVFFGKKVDLLTEASIQNPILRAELEKSKLQVYDGERAEILL